MSEAEIKRRRPPPGIDRAPRDPAGRLHRLMLVAIQVVMAIELAALARAGLWQSAATVLGIMGLTLAPLVLRERLPVRVPYAFQILVVAFVFGALFLGEVRGYYERFWWWDTVLHASSGLLLGMLGFMLIYILNADEHIHFDVRPGFMALFAFCFALALGALWELFEFAMDRSFGLTMQKPTPGDPSGLTDTMVDLAVDAAGALAVSLYGFRYMRRGEPSFIVRLIERVTRDNPELFRPRRRRRAGRVSGGE
jgi:hypothetical protein